MLHLTRTCLAEGHSSTTSVPCPDSADEGIAALERPIRYVPAKACLVSVGLGLENLTAGTARTVLPTARAGGVLQMGLTTRRVGAHDGGDDGRLPLRTTRTGVAARHPALRNGHDLLLGQTIWTVCIQSCESPVKPASFCHRGSVGSAWQC